MDHHTQEDHDCSLFSVERLETRQMLAGDLSFAVDGNDLTIRGTNGNDEVTIAADEFVVRVNGESTGIGWNQLESVNVKLRGGDDSLTIGLGFSPFVPMEKLTVNTAGGDDAVAINGASIDGATKVILGGGADTLALQAATVGATRVTTGGGADTVILGYKETALSPSLHFQEPASIRLGGGNDNLFYYVDSGVGDVELDQASLFHGNGGTDVLVVNSVMVNTDMMDPH